MSAPRILFLVVLWFGVLFVKVLSILGAPVLGPQVGSAARPENFSGDDGTLQAVDANTQQPPSPEQAEANAPARKQAGKRNTVTQLAEKTSDSIVVISTKGRGGGQRGLGTGFIVSPDGLIATSLHVIGEARPIEVRLANGTRCNVTSVHATEQSMDLAILRIDSQGSLPALELGDSDNLQVGEQVVAIGHPLGFQHSVVSGNVSGRRKLDGVPVFQLALRIEPGNSGGPLMSLDGKVHGIISMMSLRKSNVSFAVVANTLKPLLAKPNPVSMSRWLTIGALDPKKWTPLFGGNWRQRAGRIRVDGIGQGFGGRSLCLAAMKTPVVPYEIEVTVRMQQQDGAAGLVFYSDGDQKHYGFYPSSGRLRLSRFDGPDVYSWKVLQEVQTPHYRPGEWNTIKVRLEEKGIQCFINDHPVIQSTDSGYTQGKVGLAKFRHTNAEFKNFRVAKELAFRRPSAELVERLSKLVENIATERPPAGELIKKIASAKEPVPTALRERAELLEKQAQRLRELARIVHQRRVRKELSELFSEQNSDVDIDLLHAVLLLAYHDNDEIDVDAYRHEVERMVDEVRKTISAKADTPEQLKALDRYFFKEMGFHGSRIDFYNRSNSYLNEVIDDREGLPISLSVLYIEMARRLGVRVVGVGLPGHFVVRFESNEHASRLIDVFDGGREMSDEQVLEQVRSSLQEPITDAELNSTVQEFLKASTKRQIVTRMLRNLVGSTEEAESRLAYVETFLGIDPDNFEFRAHRIDLKIRTGRTEEALADIDWMLEKSPKGLDVFQVRQMRQRLEETLKQSRTADE